MRSIGRVGNLNPEPQLRKKERILFEESLDFPLTYFHIYEPLEYLNVRRYSLLIAHHCDPAAVVAPVRRRIVVGTFHFRVFFLERWSNLRTALFERDHYAELPIVLKDALKVRIDNILHIRNDLLRIG